MGGGGGFDKGKDSRRAENFGPAAGGGGLPQAVFAIGHDVETHEEVGGGVHDDASAEAFAPDAEQVGEAAVDECGGIIERGMDADEQAGDDEIGFPGGAAERLVPIVAFPIADKTHQEAAPENLL